MKKICFILFFASVVSGFADALNVRYIVQTNDVTSGALSSNRIYFSQAESIVHDVYAVRGSGTNAVAVDLSQTNVYAVWHVGSITNLTNVYLMATGAVQNGTSGWVRVEVPPSSTRIPKGDYLSQVKAYQSVGGTNVYIGSLINQKLTVFWSGDIDSYTENPPFNLTNYMTRTQADGLYVNEGQTNAIDTAMITNGAVTSVKIFDGATLSEILDDDGAGSLLDADTIDGLDSLGFVQTNSPSATNYLPKTGGTMSGSLTMDNATVIRLVDLGQTNTFAAVSNAPSWNANTMWHSGNDGGGSTLDADMLDGLNSSVFATGTPLYVESDPVWVMASTGYYTKTQSDALFGASGGDVYSTSNNTYADSTKQEMYSATFHTNGSIGMRGYVIEPKNIFLQYSSPGSIGTNTVGSTVIGGTAATIGANSDNSTIIGSDSSTITSGDNNFIGGGNNNTIVNNYNALIGGQNNDINGQYNSVLGGLNNDPIGNGNFNTIGGGQNNAMSAASHGFIGSGTGNDINSADDSAIVAGENNLIENATGLNFIGAGAENRIYGYHSTIIGAYGNSAYSDLSHVIGAYSVVTGGLHQITMGPGAHSRHSGSVVMSGHSDTPSNTNVVSTTTNQLSASFPGGIQLNANAALTVPVNIGGNFQRHAVRQPEFLGIYTNVTATTIVPYAQGDFYMDVGVTQVFWNYTGTTNGWH